MNLAFLDLKMELVPVQCHPILSLYSFCTQILFHLEICLFVKLSICQPFVTNWILSWHSASRKTSRFKIDEVSLQIFLPIEAVFGHETLTSPPKYAISFTGSKAVWTICKKSSISLDDGFPKQFVLLSNICGYNGMPRRYGVFIQQLVSSFWNICPDVKSFGPFASFKINHYALRTKYW